MSDLWTQFSLGFTEVSYQVSQVFSTEGQYLGLTTTVVDDEANSIQTINGTPYLVSVSTYLPGGYTYADLSVNSDLGGGGADQFLYNPVNGIYAYTTWQPSVSAVPASGSEDLDALNDQHATLIGDHNFPNEVLSSGANTSSSTVSDSVGWELTVEGMSDTAVLPAGEIPATIAAPLALDPVSAFGYNFDIYYPQYIWVDLGSAATLFTTGDDTVDFNNLTSDQQAAVAAGADLYNGLGGNDVVTLPNVANYNESIGNGQTLGWDPSQTFTTGSLAGQTYTVNGGDGNYNIALGAGSDAVTINGDGNSTITAGSGTDTINITGNGANNITIGYGTDDVTIKGAGANTISAGTSSAGITITNFSGSLTGSAPSPSAGATVTLTGTDTGNATIGSSSTLELATGSSLSGTITFGSTTGGTLEIDGSTMPASTINGYSTGDEIAFDNLPSGSLANVEIDETSNSLTVSDNDSDDSLDIDETTPTDSIISESSTGETTLTPANPDAADAAEEANTLLDATNTFLKSVNALSSFKTGVTTEEFDNVFGPVFTALGTLSEGGTIEDNFSQIADSPDATPQQITSAFNSAVATIFETGIKTIVSKLIIDAGEKEISSLLEGALDFAGEGTLGEFVAEAAIFTGVLEAPVVVGALAAFAATSVFNSWYQSKLQPYVDDWIAKNISPYVDTSLNYVFGIGLDVPPADNFSDDDKASILWQGSNGDVELWNPNSGSQSFTGEDLGVVGGGWQIAGTGAFNGASEAGILWRNANGDTALWNPNGSGGFTYQDLGVVDPSWQVAGTGDFNGNGEGILWRNSSGDTALWNVNGSGGYTYQDLGAVPSSWQISGTGDFTGTGADSILWQNSNGDTELWNPNGSGGFVGEDLGVVGGGWQIAGTGDFTGTGKDSILWRNSGGDTELWNPNGSGGFVGQDLGVVPTSWQVVETGDYSGNGQSGILWRNSNGDTELWNPNGSGGFTGENLGAVPTNWSVQKIFA